jgi:hypothetical protein
VSSGRGGNNPIGLERPGDSTSEHGTQPFLVARLLDEAMSTTDPVFIPRRVEAFCHTLDVRICLGGVPISGEDGEPKPSGLITRRNLRKLRPIL